MNARAARATAARSRLQPCWRDFYAAGGPRADVGVRAASLGAKTADAYCSVQRLGTGSDCAALVRAPADCRLLRQAGQLRSRTYCVASMWCGARGCTAAVASVRSAAPSISPSRAAWSWSGTSPARATTASALATTARTSEYRRALVSTASEYQGLRGPRRSTSRSEAFRRASPLLPPSAADYSAQPAPSSGHRAGGAHLRLKVPAARVLPDREAPARAGARRLRHGLLHPEPGPSRLRRPILESKSNS